MRDGLPDLAWHVRISTDSTKFLGGFPPVFFLVFFLGGGARGAAEDTAKPRALEEPNLGGW